MTNAAAPQKEEPKTRRGLIWLLRSAFAFSLAVCAVPAYAAKDISAKGIKRENIKLTYTSGNVEIKKGGKSVPITRAQQGIYPSGYGPPQSYYDSMRNNALNGTGDYVVTTGPNSSAVFFLCSDKGENGEQYDKTFIELKIIPIANVVYGAIDAGLEANKFGKEAKDFYKASPPTVAKVTVSPATATIKQGSKQQFKAAVEGANNPPQTVTWSLTGAGSGTKIDASSGLLTIGKNQTPTTLFVSATSTADTSKSARIRVTVSADASEADKAAAEKAAKDKVAADKKAADAAEAKKVADTAAKKAADAAATKKTAAAAAKKVK